MSIGLYEEPQSLVSTNSHQRLLLRPRPTQHESWYGYLTRVSDQNGLTSFRELLKFFQSFEHFQRTLRLHDDEVDLLDGPMPSKLNTGKRGNLYNHNITFFRWCPECIKNHPIHQSRWQLTYYVVCLEHKIQLKDTCPNCDHRQHLERPQLWRCQFCGANLRSSSSKKVDPVVYDYQQELMKAFEGIKTTTLFNLTYCELIKLTRYIGQFNDQHMPVKPGKYYGTTEVNIAFSVLSVAAKLLNHWPTLLYELVSKVQAQSTVSLSIKHHFGTFYQVLYVNLKEDCYQFLRDAFEDYLFMYWPSLINKRNKGFKKGKTTTHSRLTIKQMAVKTGAKPALIKLLISTNQIKLEKVLLPSGRQVRLIHEKYIQELSILANEVLSLKQLALRVGVTESRIRQLIATEQIIPLASKFALNSAQWYFEQNQLANLSFNAIACEPHCIPITQILKSWRLSASEFNALVKALRKEELIIYSQDNLVVFLGDIWLDPIQTKKWLLSYREAITGLLSIDQVAKKLRIKQEVAYHLVRKGLIPHTITFDRVLKVQLGELEKFKQDYISLRDISKRLELAPQKALNSLRAVPVCGPSIDDCRQYFYRRLDIFLFK